MVLLQEYVFDTMEEAWRHGGMCFREESLYHYLTHGQYICHDLKEEEGC